MTSNPVIKYVSASKDDVSTLIMALLENTNSGMVQMRSFIDTSCITEDPEMRNYWCVENLANPYISNLYKIVNTYKSSPTLASSACLRAYTCSSGENCGALECSAWNSSFASEKGNIPISIALGNVPIAVSNLSLTPGDRSISVSWGDVDQPTSIWAYDIILSQGETQLIKGTITEDNKIIGNLINGTEYTVSVRPRSFDGYNGPWTAQTATPIAPTCTIPECIIIITQ